MTTITLKLDPLGTDSAKAAGYIDVIPAQDASPTVFYPRQRVRATFDGATAEVPLTLLASDDASLLGVPLVYWVHEHLTNVAGNPPPYPIQLLIANGSTQYLAPLRAAALGTAPPDVATYYIPLAQRGVAGGVATLDSTAHVPAAQLGAGTPADSQVLTIDPITHVPTWDDPTGGGGAVSSVNGATGDVTVDGTNIDATDPQAGTPVLLNTILGTLWTAITGKLTNPMTTAGDLIRGGAAGAAQRLAVGSAGTVLTPVAGTPAWGTDADVTAQDPSNGGVVTALRTILSNLWTAILARAALTDIGLGISATADGDAYYVAPIALTFGTATAQGTGTITYEKALNASPSVFSSATIPVTLAAGDILHINFASVSGWKSVTLKRTA